MFIKLRHLVKDEPFAPTLCALLRTNGNCLKMQIDYLTYFNEPSQNFNDDYFS